MSSAAERGLRSGRRGPAAGWVAIGVVVAVVAFVARLQALLRGGGLHGLGNYDDGVYYSAAVALTHGHLPYRDFLFLHPPGIILALSPFAAIGRLTSDPSGMAVGRLAFMALGAVSAVLVVWTLRSCGRFAAGFAGLFYALSFAAIYAEHLTLLEGLGGVLVLAALALLSRPGDDIASAAGDLPRWRELLAGAALAASACVKVWGVAAVVIVAATQAVMVGRRSSVRLVVGAVVGAVTICLPFFVAAPGAMTRLVISDQLGRGRAVDPLPERLANMLGIGGVTATLAFTPLVVGALLVSGLAVVLAWQIRQSRGWVVLLAGLSVVLLTGPSWFLHYSGLIAGPLALVVGAAVAQLSRLVPRRLAALRPVAGVALTVGLVVYAAPGLQVELGQPFPGKVMIKAARRVPGCVTSDDPSTLVQMDVLNRDYVRRCRVLVDVSGATYDNVDVRTPDGQPVAREDNRPWQLFLRTYLLSGSATMLARRAADGLDATTRDSLGRLRVLRRSAGYTLLGR